MNNPRKANGHRRRQVEKRVFAEEDHCWICGKPVDYTLPYIDPVTGKPHPMYRTVDEIVPVSKGGSPIKRGNCRLAHRICNLRRGNGSRKKARTKVATTLKTSRQW